MLGTFTLKFNLISQVLFDVSNVRSMAMTATTIVIRPLVQSVAMLIILSKPVPIFLNVSTVMVLILLSPEIAYGGPWRRLSKGLRSQEGFPTRMAMPWSLPRLPQHMMYLMQLPQLRSYRFLNLVRLLSQRKVWRPKLAGFYK